MIFFGNANKMQIYFLLVGILVCDFLFSPQEKFVELGKKFETSEESSIFRLKIHIFRLQIRIFRLQIYIFSLKIENCSDVFTF